VKPLIRIFLILIAGAVNASSDVSRYTMNDLTYEFDGKCRRSTLYSHLHLFDDVDLEEYREAHTMLPVNGKVKEAFITVRPKHSKAKVYQKGDAALISDLDPGSLISESRALRWNLDKVDAGCEIDYYFDIEDEDALCAEFHPTIDRIPVDTFIVRIKFPSKKWRLKYSIDNSEPAYIDSADLVVFAWYNMPALKGSPYENAPTDFLPGIWFTFESKTGVNDMADWNGVYMWANERVNNTAPFRDPASMLEIANSPEQIIDAIGQKCHYVSIQLGEGRWAPPPAEEVWNKGYGDCKGLAGLFIGWMRAAGFNAWPVLVQATKSKAGKPEFPSQYVFNHAIAAYVTLNNDTAYQDLTAEYYPPGYLPIELFGCLALPIGPGSVPLRLGVLPREPDTTEIAIEGYVSDDDNLLGFINIRIKGMAALRQNWLGAWTRSVNWERTLKPELESLLPQATFQKVKADSIAPDEISISSEIVIRRFCYQRENKMAYRPWLFEFIRPDIESDTARVWPMFLKRNDLFNISYRVKLKDPISNRTAVNSTSRDFGRFSFELENSSHGDSLSLDLTLCLRPSILQPHEVDAYRHDRVAMLRALDSQVNFDIPGN
jgi:hypothetical protein